MTENPEDVVSSYFEIAPTTANDTPQRRKELAAEASQAFSARASDLLASPDLASEAIAFVRELLDNRERLLATSFSHRLMRDVETETLGRLCAAVIALRLEYNDYAWRLMNFGDREDAIRHVPAEYLGLWLMKDPVAADAHLRAMAEGGFDSHLTPLEYWPVARRAGALKKYDLLAILMDKVIEIDGELKALPDADRIDFQWTRDYLAAHPQRDRVESTSQVVSSSDFVEGREEQGEPAPIHLGIIDYKMLDRSHATTNIGDYVQTLAFLSNLARFQSVEYDDSPLGRKLEEFKGRVEPEKRIRKMAAKVVPVAVNRDFSSWDAIPKLTWTFAYGWYMHPTFETMMDFPFHPNVRPIFISFHVNNRGMLTERAVDYLKTYQPIGCRDWTTVYLLREKGIRAFFSGCITTTIGQLFSEPAADVDRDTIALVDYEPSEGEFGDAPAVPYTQALDSVRDLKLVDALDSAVTLLNGYRRYAKIATSRLHCYLPCTSLGLEVVFQPKRRSDIRFEGLLNLNRLRFRRIRTGIEDKVESMLRAILSGASEEKIYAKWQRLCEADLAYAEEYCTTFPPLPEPSFDIASTVEGLRASAYTLNDAPIADDPVIAAFALDGNLTEMLPVTIESAMTNLSRPAIFYVLARGIERTYFEELAKDFPTIQFKIYDFDGVNYGEHLNLLKHTTASTIDRLLLADLLVDVKKIIYLDVDIVIQGDLARLYDTDLEGKPLAGKSSIPVTWRTGHDLVHRAVARLKAARAWVLRRRMFAEGSLEFRAFNAGVTVMNLERMRADKSSLLTVPLVENFGMNDQDALNMYARADRVEFDAIWNAIPMQEMTGKDGILHFAGSTKPWGPSYVLRGEEYDINLTRYQARRKSRLAANHAQ